MALADSRPRINPSVVLAAVDEGYLAFDTQRDRLHRLNPVAALVLEMCDGTRDLTAVREAVLPIIGGPGGASWPACQHWIETARRDHLLLADVATGHPPSPSQSPSAAELSLQAARLLENDHTLAAFVCQKRATELSPDDPQSWYQLGEYVQVVGQRDEARRAYERYSLAHPEDAEIEHLLTALSDKSPPPRASDQYIEQLYERFAGFYDSNMSEDLEYRGPSRLYEALTSAIGHQTRLDILDLGCGTGLSGLLLRRRARRLSGVDLSESMIQRAHARGIYDELATDEITHWLSTDTRRQFDVIAACDTLIYFGDLRQVIIPAGRRLRPDGVLVFTTEQGEQAPFGLTDSGRYAHHRTHVAEVATEAGLYVHRLNESVLRYEYGEPVIGLVGVLRRVAS